MILELQSQNINNKTVMDIKNLEKNWNAFGSKDPMWAILTFPDKKNNKWDVQEFFNSGKQEISELINQINQYRIQFPRRNALDFGCGVGRLTQALAPYFNETTGVDIAQSMIEQAREFNQFGEKCKYILNTADNLSVLPSDHFDLIYSNITLQHMAPVYSRKYISEFIRVLHPEGVLVFQIPSERLPDPQTGGLKQKIKKLTPQPVLKLWRAIRFFRRPVMEMHTIPKDEVLQLLKENHARAVQIEQFDSAGNSWKSFRYYVTKVKG